MFAEQSDAVQIVLAFCGVLTTLGMGFLAYLGLRLKAGQEKAAVEVKEVKATASRTAAAQGQQLVAIHTLVNSEMHLALEANARLAKRVAESSGDPADVAAAADAAEKLAKHDAKQALLDQSKAKGG